MIRAVIFDVDGVMIDSEPLHMEAWDKALQVFGHNLSELSNEFQNHMPGKKPDKIAEEMITTLHIDAQPESILQQKAKLYTELLTTKGKEMPGLNRLVHHLKEKGFRLGIGTSGQKMHVTILLEKFRLEEYFDVIVTGEEVTKGKPDPQTYQLVVEHLGLKPEECVVIEDSQNGILSAKAAGCYCIAFKGSDYLVQDQSAADKIVHSLEEITEDVLNNV